MDGAGRGGGGGIRVGTGEKRIEGDSGCKGKRDKGFVCVCSRHEKEASF